MKTVRYLTPARKALVRHAADAQRIRKKVRAYAVSPGTQANNVKRLKRDREVLRLRVGNFRVLFIEDADSVTVLDLGPRGGIYD